MEEKGMGRRPWHDVTSGRIWSNEEEDGEE